jgi:hypothetical protein
MHNDVIRIRTTHQWPLPLNTSKKVVVAAACGNAIEALDFAHY